MRLLVLGGTLFLGRHIVAAALSRGARVTTFTRGRTNPEQLRGVDALHGDRDGDLRALRDRSWDAVIDTSAYTPRQAAATADLLRDAVGAYVLLSTASVYATFPEAGASELTPTLAPASADAPMSPALYGPLKVAAELAVRDRLGDRAIIVRPGLLIGPLDVSARFRYWVQRVAEGGDVLAPGDPHRLLQLLDARDLAEWLLTAASLTGGGIYNASGPETPLTMKDLLTSIRDVVNADAHFTWVSDEFLLEQNVQPWSELPLWLPGEASAALRLQTGKARAAGLRCRPLRESIADVLADDTAEAAPLAGGLPKARGLERARERGLLHTWRERDL